VKFTLRMLNTTAQLGMLVDEKDTFRDAIERQIAARTQFADIWSKYGVVEPTFYGSGHHWMSHPQRFADPWVVMGYAAARWPEAHINSNFIQWPLFSAIDAAEKVSSIAGLTDRGVTLVVGLGWRPEEFLAAGTEVKKRVSRFEESIAICRALWAGEEVDFQSDHWTVKGKLGRPLTSEDDVALVIGAQSAAGARRAARIGDGAHISWVMSHDSYRMINDAYRDELAKFGKPNPRYWAMAKFISVDPDAAKAHARLDRMESMFSWYSGGGGSSTWVGDDVKINISREEEADERTVTGTPEQVVDQLLGHAKEYPYTDAILTWLAPGRDPKENLEHFEMLSEQVVLPLAAKLGLPKDQVTLRV
jgi:alkanesulfonate monooxygenase SsuD/methylene tetrahydromethanopterin reductase-like flavin-dependent oxidoreductase (luciferase family)